MLKQIKIIFALYVFIFSSGVFASAAFTTLDGQQISMQSLKGKWVLINYWASWCQPCIKEIPHLNRFATLYKEKARLFAVNFDNASLGEQKTQEQQFQIQYTSLQSDPAKSLAFGDVNAVPVTFVLNPEGKLVKTLYGPQSLRSLEEAIR